jgi:hypothetical protein
VGIPSVQICAGGRSATGVPTSKTQGQTAQPSQICDGGDADAKRARSEAISWIGRLPRSLSQVTERADVLRHTMNLRLGLRYYSPNFGSGLKCACHSRRDVLEGIGAIATTGIFWPGIAIAQTAPASGGPIDPAIIDDLVVANHILADQGVLVAWAT